MQTPSQVGAELGQDVIQQLTLRETQKLCLSESPVESPDDPSNCAAWETHSLSLTTLQSARRRIRQFTYPSHLTIEVSPLDFPSFHSNF